jgi:hypothetical protein
MLRKWMTKGSVCLVSLVFLASCSVEESAQDKEENDAIEQENSADIGEEEMDESFSAAKPVKTPETGESAACASQKQSYANFGIFIHPSGKRIRYINTRLSYANAKQACAASSTVATLRLATKAELALFTDIFTLPDSSKCNTDVWTTKTTTQGTRILMPAVTALPDGKDGKVICVVQE